MGTTLAHGSSTDVIAAGVTAAHKGARMKDQGRDEALIAWQADATRVTTGLAAVDRRAFLMRSAVTGAAAVLAGCAAPSPQETASSPTPPPAPKAAGSRCRRTWPSRSRPRAR